MKFLPQVKGQNTSDLPLVHFSFYLAKNSLAAAAISRYMVLIHSTMEDYIVAAARRFLAG